MRHRIISAAVAALAGVASTGLGADANNAIDQSPRNIVVILADDMGWSDLGCYGSEIRTPNLDRLAREGMCMTQFYNAARCCPSRATLLTGLYAHQAGVGHMVENRGLPAYQGYLNDRCVTIAEALRPAGYRTYMSGKWHVGEAQENWPTHRGFDRYFGLISGASSYFELSINRAMAMDGEPWKPPTDGSFYMTDAITDHAVQFIDEHRENHQDKPMFLYVAYTAPHWPLHAKPEDIARYRGRYMQGWDALREARHERQVAMGLVDPGWDISPRHENAKSWDELSDDGKADFDTRMAVYAAQVDSMDQGIGRIISALEQAGTLQNTVIMFMADNGGCAERIERGEAQAQIGTAASFSAYGLPWANASNTPFRRFKQHTHEGGIASPLIAYGPGIPSGAITGGVGHLIDVMPTCLEIAGADYPEAVGGQPVPPLEGQSLLPLLSGQDWARDKPLFWEHQGHRAVRSGDMKLVAAFKGEWELYDLEADRTETHDLAAERPDVVRELSAQWDQWAQRCGVQDFASLPPLSK